MYATMSLLTLTGAAGAMSDITVYRLSPNDGPGVVSGLTNVDSGDAAGDTMFGISQLLLPQICARDPGFLWCQNRKTLSDGDHWMVYTQYTVGVSLWGEYMPCNPCQNPQPGSNSSNSGMAPPKCPEGKPEGTFVCGEFGGGDKGGGGGEPHLRPDVPKQCASGFDLWERDCLEGTVFKTLQGTDEGGCCAACAQEGGKCAGWNMPQGYKGGTCELMAFPLTVVSDKAKSPECKSAEAWPSRGPTAGCWYDSPHNKSFAKHCNASQCECEAMFTMPVGREEGAMCHEGRRRALQEAPAPPLSLHGGPAGAVPPFWNCTATISKVCPHFQWEDPPGCMACAAENAPVLAAAGCTPEHIAHGCSVNFETCASQAKKTCGKASQEGGSNECVECMLEHADVMEAANCSALLLNYVCDGGAGGNEWEDYLTDFACLLNGTWYSTQSTGECTTATHGQQSLQGEGDDEEDCFWKIKKKGRTVNASCVDSNVAKTVEAVAPSCFSGCPQPQNQSSACYLHCLFDTMLGKLDPKTHKRVGGMTKKAIVGAFVSSFTSSDPEAGGCPSAVASLL